MKKKEFVTQDLLSKIYQQNSPQLHKLPPERQLAEEYGGSGKPIIQLVGGTDDINKVWHCMTLLLVGKNNRG